MNETKQTPTIAVTGASGHLGRLVIEALLNQNIAADSIVALVRDPEKINDFAERGVQVRLGDYKRKETLDAALSGVERLLLISSNEVGKRLAQHENVVSAARESGVKLLAYTSILKADTSRMQLAAEHLATENLIRESGIGFAFLRNGWYFENYTEHFSSTLKYKAVFGSAGSGRVSAASRADYAAAAAAVLIGDGAGENKVYELGGDVAFTLSELAAEISKQTGEEIVYRDLPAEDFAQALIGAGLPEPLALSLADADLGLKRGELLAEEKVLSRLINRPTTTLTDAVAAALKK